MGEKHSQRGGFMDAFRFTWWVISTTQNKLQKQIIAISRLAWLGCTLHVTVVMPTQHDGVKTKQALVEK